MNITETYTKTAETLDITEFPLFLTNETSGIRTPDNLIKSQVISPLFSMVCGINADILRTLNKISNVKER